MPTVPRLTGQSVATAPLPGARITPTVAPALGPDLSGPIGAAQHLVEQAQQRAYEGRLLDVSGQLSDLETHLVTQARSQRGESAFNARTTVADTWQAQTAAIEQTLPDVLKLPFRQQAQTHWNSLNRAVEEHVAGEIQRFGDEKAAGVVEKERKAAITSYDDPQRVDDSIQRQRMAILINAEHNGVPAEVRENAIADATSKTRAGVLDQLLTTNRDLDAKSYLEQHKADFVGADLLGAEKAVHVGSVRGESQRLADSITARASSLSDALDQVKKQASDPEVRDATEERVRRTYSEQQENLRLVRAQMTVGDLNTLEQAKGDLHAIPIKNWNMYTLGEREGFRAYAVQLQKGLPVDTNWSTYYTLMRQAASSDPKDRAAFVQSNLLQHRGELADQQFEQLTGLQNSVQKGDQEAVDRLGQFRTLDQIVHSSAIQAGVIGSKASPNDPRLTELFRRAEEEATRLENATKKKPSSEDMQHIVDGLLLEGTLKDSGIFGSSFLQTKRRAYQLQAGEGPRFQVGRVPYAAIPAADRADLEQRIRTAGGTVSNDRIERAYAAVINGDRDGAKRILSER